MLLSPPEKGASSIIEETPFLFNSSNTVTITYQEWIKSITCSGLNTVFTLDNFYCQPKAIPSVCVALKFKILMYFKDE